MASVAYRPVKGKKGDPIIVRRTYDIVTPEDSRVGEPSELGWIDADGDRIPWQTSEGEDDEAWKLGRKRAEVRFRSAKQAAEFISAQGPIDHGDGYSYYFEAYTDSPMTAASVSEAAHVDAMEGQRALVYDHLSKMPSPYLGSRFNALGEPMSAVKPSISHRTRRSRGPGPGWWRDRQRHAAAARKGWRRR